jgi:hypothetical protein
MRCLIVLAAALIVAATLTDRVTVADTPVVERRVVYLIEQKPQSVLRGQAIAQSRADYMARYNYRGHPPKSAGNQWSVVGANFEGVGWNSSPSREANRVGTCRPSGRSGPHDDNSRKLLGDAVSRSRYGTFRVRIWGR